MLSIQIPIPFKDLLHAVFLFGGLNVSGWLPSPVNHKCGGDRGIQNLPPLVPCIPDTRPFFPLGFFPLTLFRLRNSKHCCVIPNYFSRFTPYPYPHTAHGHNGKPVVSQQSDKNQEHYHLDLVLFCSGRIAIRQDELILCAWELLLVSAKEFPLAILVKLAGYVIKWLLWNSTAKLCDRLKSFVPLSRSVRTKLKPITTCSGSFFPRLVRSLITGFEFWLVDFNSCALVNQSQI